MRISAHRQASDIRAFYRHICDQIDPGQSRLYQDYRFSPKIAAMALQFLEQKILSRVCTSELLLMARTARLNLAAK